jgi:rod shape determining protein RodA
MKDFFKFFDKFTFMVLLLLTFTGIVLIYSAAYTLEQSHFSKQLLWLFFALCAFFLVFKFKTESLFNLSFFIYLTLVIILVLQIAAGRIISGTKSWIKMGFFYIQVSEFIKIPLALYLAKTLTRFSVIDWRNFIKLIIILGIPFILIAMQPDLGTAFILSSFMIFAVILKKVKPVIVIFTLLAVTAGAFGVWNYVLKPYQQDRIISFLNPEKYKKSTGYQIIQSKIAVGSGGLTGKGYLNGTQSQYKFLPTRHTDFIVSVLGEEFGFLGISFLFILFFIFFYRQFNIKTESDEEFYYVNLFNGLILVQFLVNILMSIGFFPVMGVPLPFVSYGGSSLLAFFIGEAIIFKIKLNTFLNEF